MTIQWYPGHMHKARKEIQKALPLIDIVFEILDARLPHSSRNPMIGKIAAHKKRLSILTKSDLADPDKTTQWLAYLRAGSDIDAIAVTTQQPQQIRRLIEQCTAKLAGRPARDKTLNIMIMGIPNVGKSTLINILANKNIAKTGNEPAVTKGQQRIKLQNGILLFDTPGMLWPKVENEKSAYRLAVTGAIKDSAMSYVDVAFFAAEFMLNEYPQPLIQRYGLLTPPAAEIEFLEAAGRARGCLGSGGRVDLERIATLFLNDLRSGALGPVTLEIPALIEPEEEAVRLLNAEKEQKDKQRREQRKQKAGKPRRR